MKEASCGTVCAGVRRRCLYNKFSGALIGIRRGREALIGDGTLIGYRALIRIFTVNDFVNPEQKDRGLLPIRNLFNWCKQGLRNS